MSLLKKRAAQVLLVAVVFLVRLLNVGRFLVVVDSDAPFGQTEVTTLLKEEDEAVPTSTAASTTSKKMPRIIWMYWESGWPAPRAEANLARASFEYANPTYQVRAMDATLADTLTNRTRYISAKVWSQTKVQARSDVYRTLLLDQYGGVWADASLFCNFGLDQWINVDQQNDLFAFQRTDPQSILRPHISSWFLISPPKGSILAKVKKIFLQNQELIKGTKEKNYFWWHSIVAGLTRTDKAVGTIVNNFASADAAHAFTNNWPQSPVYKRNKNDEMYKVFATTLRCCYKEYIHRKQQLPFLFKWARKVHRPPAAAATQWNNLCQSWNCHNQSDNLVHRWDAMTATWTAGNETRALQQASKFYVP